MNSLSKLMKRVLGYGPTLGYPAILVWHIWMNTMHWLGGWNPSWLNSQFMGIPFLVDHWLKYSVLLIAFWALKITYEKIVDSGAGRF